MIMAMSRPTGMAAMLPNLQDEHNKQTSQTLGIGIWDAGNSILVIIWIHEMPEISSSKNKI